MGLRSLLLLLFFLLNYFIFFTSFSHASDDVIPRAIVKHGKMTTKSITAGPKKIIKKSDILKSGATNIAQVLQTSSSIQIKDMNGTGSNASLVMRGFGENANSNSLLLINGIPVNNPDLAAPDLNAIPISEIEAIEIISGSESVLYGDQAVGGVVNIITRGKRNNRYVLSVDAGSYAAKNIAIGMHENWQNLQYNLNVSGLETQNYREHNRYNTVRLFGNTKLDYTYGFINLDFSIGNEKMLYPGALTRTQVKEDRRQAANNTDYFKDQNGFINANIVYLLPHNWSFNVDMMLRQMNGNGVLTSPFDQNRHTFFIRPAITGNLKKWAILAGLELQKDQYQLKSSFGKTSDVSKQYSGFAILTYPLTPTLEFNVGLRGAKQCNDLDAFTDMNYCNAAMAETIGILYQITDAWNFYLRRAGSFRFPKADENASIPVGSKGLKPQRGASYEVGVQNETGFYYLSIGGYILYLKDEIAFDPLQTPENPFGTNRNYPPTIREGLSASGQLFLNNNVTLDGQINYVNARFNTGILNGKRIPLVSEWVIRSGLNYHFKAFWNFYTEGIYTGPQYAANDVLNVSGIFGGYTIFNMNLRYEKKNYSLGLHVNNLLNKKFYLYTVFQSDVMFYYPAPERNFMFIFNYFID